MENCIVARLTESLLVCFYYKQEVGIAYKEYELGKWGGEKVLLESTRPEFTMGLDEKGGAYLFCQDAGGDVILVTNTKGGWEGSVVLKNQSDGVFAVSISPLIENGRMSFLYNAPDNDSGEQRLVFQEGGAAGKGKPAVTVDRLAYGGRRPYVVQRVSPGHVLAFYAARSAEGALGYREITVRAQSRFNVIHPSGAAVADSSFLTTNSAVYALYIVKTMFTCQLLFRKKDSERFTEPMLLWESQSLDNCLLFYAGGELYAAYTNNGRMYCCVSKDGGGRFSKPFRYRAKLCLSPVKARYFSFPAQSEDAFFCHELYVDSAGLWDVQILPDLYPDFYPAPAANAAREQAPPALEPYPAAFSELEARRPEGEIPAGDEMALAAQTRALKEKVLILESRIILLGKELAQKDALIAALKQSNGQKAD